VTHPLFKWRGLERHPMEETERYFFSPTQFVGMRLEDQKPAYFKPTGLWYACGPEWLDWSEYNWTSQVDDWRYLYKLTLGKKILRLQTSQETVRFARKYATDVRGRSLREGVDLRGLFNLDWPRVAERYNGIEICPYHWGLRDEMLWYSTWDVASGCIWNPAGLRNVELVATAERDWQLEAV